MKWNETFCNVCVRPYIKKLKKIKMGILSKKQKNWIDGEGETSKKKISHHFFLPTSEATVKVCGKMFRETLGKFDFICVNAFYDNDISNKRY